MAHHIHRKKSLVFLRFFSRPKTILRYTNLFCHLGHGVKTNIWRRLAKKSCRQHLSELDFVFKKLGFSKKYCNLFQKSWFFKKRLQFISKSLVFQKNIAIYFKKLGFSRKYCNLFQKAWFFKKTS